MFYGMQLFFNYFQKILGPVQCFTLTSFSIYNSFLLQCIEGKKKVLYSSLKKLNKNNNNQDILNYIVLTVNSEGSKMNET